MSTSHQSKGQNSHPHVKPPNTHSSTNAPRSSQAHKAERVMRGFVHESRRTIRERREKFGADKEWKIMSSILKELQALSRVSKAYRMFLKLGVVKAMDSFLMDTLPQGILVLSLSIVANLASDSSICAVMGPSMVQRISDKLVESDSSHSRAKGVRALTNLASNPKCAQEIKKCGFGTQLMGWLRTSLPPWDSIFAAEVEKDEEEEEEPANVPGGVVLVGGWMDRWNAETGGAEKTDEGQVEESEESRLGRVYIQSKDNRDYLYACLRFLAIVGSTTETSSASAEQLAVSGKASLAAKQTDTQIQEQAHVQGSPGGVQPPKSVGLHADTTEANIDPLVPVVDVIGCAFVVAKYATCFLLVSQAMKVLYVYRDHALAVSDHGKANAVAKVAPPSNADVGKIDTSGVPHPSSVYAWSEQLLDAKRGDGLRVFEPLVHAMVERAISGESEDGQKANDTKEKPGELLDEEQTAGSADQPVIALANVPIADVFVALQFTLVLLLQWAETGVTIRLRMATQALIDDLCALVLYTQGKRSARALVARLLCVLSEEAVSRSKIKRADGCQGLVQVLLSAPYLETVPSTADTHLDGDASSKEKIAIDTCDAEKGSAIGSTEAKAIDRSANATESGRIKCGPNKNALDPAIERNSYVNLIVVRALLKGLSFFRFDASALASFFVASSGRFSLGNSELTKLLLSRDLPIITYTMLLMETATATERSSDAKDVVMEKQLLHTIAMLVRESPERSPLRKQGIFIFRHLICAHCLPRLVKFDVLRIIDMMEPTTATGTSQCSSVQLTNNSSLVKDLKRQLATLVADTWGLMMLKSLLEDTRYRTSCALVLGLALPYLPPSSLTYAHAVDIMFNAEINVTDVLLELISEPQCGGDLPSTDFGIIGNNEDLQHKGSTDQLDIDIHCETFSRDILREDESSTGDDGAESTNKDARDTATETQTGTVELTSHERIRAAQVLADLGHLVRTEKAWQRVSGWTSDITKLGRLDAVGCNEADKGSVLVDPNKKSIATERGNSNADGESEGTSSSKHTAHNLSSDSISADTTVMKERSYLESEMGTKRIAKADVLGSVRAGTSSAGGSVLGNNCESKTPKANIFFHPHNHPLIFGSKGKNIDGGNVQSAVGTDIEVDTTVADLKTDMEIGNYTVGSVAGEETQSDDTLEYQKTDNNKSGSTITFVVSPPTIGAEDTSQDINPTSHWDSNDLEIPIPIPSSTMDSSEPSTPEVELSNEDGKSRPGHTEHCDVPESYSADRSCHNDKLSNVKEETQTNQTQRDVSQSARLSVDKTNLCAVSTYFQSMLSGHFSEGDQNEIQITSCGARAFKSLLAYLLPRPYGVSQVDPIPSTTPAPSKASKSPFDSSRRDDPGSTEKVQSEPAEVNIWARLNSGKDAIQTAIDRLDSSENLEDFSQDDAMKATSKKRRNDSKEANIGSRYTKFDADKHKRVKTEFQSLKGDEMDSLGTEVSENIGIVDLDFAFDNDHVSESAGEGDVDSRAVHHNPDSKDADEFSEGEVDSDDGFNLGSSVGKSTNTKATTRTTAPLIRRRNVDDIQNAGWREGDKSGSPTAQLSAAGLEPKLDKASILGSGIGGQIPTRLTNTIGPITNACCEKYFYEHLVPEDALALIPVAQQYMLTELRELCIHKSLEHIKLFPEAAYQIGLSTNIDVLQFAGIETVIEMLPQLCGRSHWVPSHKILNGIKSYLADQALHIS